MTAQIVQKPALELPTSSRAGSSPTRRHNPPPKPLGPDAAEDLAVLHQLAAELRTPCVVGDVLDPDAWISEDPGDLDAAAAVCAGCPLVDECTSWGRAHTPHGGQWGRYRFRPRGLVAAGWHEAMGTTPSKRKTTPRLRRTDHE